MESASLLPTPGISRHSGCIYTQPNAEASLYAKYCTDDDWEDPKTFLLVKISTVESARWTHYAIDTRTLMPVTLATARTEKKAFERVMRNLREHGYLV